VLVDATDSARWVGVRSSPPPGVTVGDPAGGQRTASTWQAPGKHTRGHRGGPRSAARSVQRVPGGPARDAEACEGDRRPRALIVVAGQQQPDAGEDKRPEGGDAQQRGPGVPGRHPQHDQHPGGRSSRRASRLPLGASGACFAAVVVAAAVGLLLAAAFAPAPPAALPLVVLAGVGMPMAVAYQLPPAVSSLRGHRRLVTALRRDLAQLPETAHPFDG
jgi:hypothetical protein